MVPFQLGVITDEISSDFEHALDVMQEYEVRQVELRELWSKNVLHLSSEETLQAKTAIHRRGMTVCSIASPFYKCSLGSEAKGMTDGDPAPERMLHGAAESTLQEQMGILERAFELAHFFGAPIVRVFAFWREMPLTTAVMESIQEAFQRPLELAEQNNLVLGLENEHACLIGTGEETAALLHRVNSPFLRCVWDPGNAYQLGEEAFPVGYRAVKDWIAHVHVKDARKVVGPDGQVSRPWTVVGAGDIGYRAQFQALIEDDYRGVVSLETHYRNPEGDREASSRECLTSIRRLLAELS